MGHWTISVDMPLCPPLYISIAYGEKISIDNQKIRQTMLPYSCMCPKAFIRCRLTLSCCSPQGQKHNDHFGFICRETPAPVSAPAAAPVGTPAAPPATPPVPAPAAAPVPGPAPGEGQPGPAPAPPTGPTHHRSSYVGYIFRCQNDRIAEDVINSESQLYL